MGGRPTQSAGKFGELIGHLEKALGLPHTQAEIIPGEQRHSGSGCAPCLSTHGALGLQGGASLTSSCPPGDEHVTRRPPQPHGPWRCGLHTQDPGGSLAGWPLGTAKLPGWALRPLQLPAGSRGLYCTMGRDLWTLAFVLAFLRTVGLFPGQKEDRGSETGVHHSSRLHST